MNHWTHELLDLMVGKLVDRKQRLHRPVEAREEPKVSDAQLFARMGKRVKVVKRGPNSRGRSSPNHGR